MRTWPILVILATVALATGARADEHEEMRAALHELKIAQRHLQAAPITYEGHRMAALTAVKQALIEIRQGLALTKREQQDGSGPRGEKRGGAARRGEKRGGQAPDDAAGGDDD